MLILQRRPLQSIMIGHDVIVTILGVQGNHVRIGIKAPKTTSIHREEVYDRIHGENGDSPEARQLKESTHG